MIEQAPPASGYSSTAAAPPVPQPRRRTLIDRLRRSMPATLRGQFAALGAISILLCLVSALASALAISEARKDLGVIADKTVPVVDAAQNMMQSAFELSGYAADYLATAPLANREPCRITASQPQVGSITVHECSDRNIDAQVAKFNQQLFKAANKAIFPGEPIAIQRITAGFETLTAQLALMRDAYRTATSRSDPRDDQVADPHSEPMRKSYAAFQMAIAALQTQKWPAQNTAGLAIPSCDVDTAILPGTDWPFDTLEYTMRCLSKTNKVHLDNAFNETLGEQRKNLIVAIICGVLLCGFLLATTWRMATVTHRIVNPGLTLALLLGIAGSSLEVYRFYYFSGKDGLFHIMVQDAYESYYRSIHLKQYALAANADESRWLVAKAFDDEQAATRWYQDWQFRTSRVQDDIQKLKAQRTWPAEDAPLRDLANNWTAYAATDRQIRATASNVADPAHIVNAERLSTGASNTTFAGVLDAADRLAAINYTMYNGAQQRITASINSLAQIGLWLFCLAALAAAGGIYARWKDF